tara:strand:- start:185 stop:652 length:468 start_codon:yes stop_codon:yes gene_type:complete
LTISLRLTIQAPRRALDAVTSMLTPMSRRLFTVSPIGGGKGGKGSKRLSKQSPLSAMPAGSCRGSGGSSAATADGGSSDVAGGANGGGGSSSGGTETTEGGAQQSPAAEQPHDANAHADGSGAPLAAEEEAPPRKAPHVQRLSMGSWTSPLLKQL